MLQFKAEQLGNAILDLQHNCFCGVAHIAPLVQNSKSPSAKVLAFHNGEVIYGGLCLPNAHDLSQQLGQHFKLQIMDAALQLADKKIKDQSFIRQYLDLYIRLDLFSWQDIEKFICNQIILTLEQLLPFGGTIRLDTAVQLDLTYGEDGHGFTWEQLIPTIVKRQRVWASLSPAIVSTNAIPHCLDAAHHTITDPWIQQHIKQWVDGQHTLGEIAYQVGRDPLELAHSYLHFVQMGWLTFHNPNTHIPNLHSVSTTDNKRGKLPIILSVDDSPVVQTMIKRAIGNCYELLLANNAMDALSLLNREKVELLLLDVTMPDIDGLELCRTLRNINKFRDLPVVMLTAKDGMLNKIKGQIAGSTQYLTKPIDRQKLMAVIDKYVPTAIMS